jgi:hypothetical protein
MESYIFDSLLEAEKSKLPWVKRSTQIRRSVHHIAMIYTEGCVNHSLSPSPLALLSTSLTFIRVSSHNIEKESFDDVEF